MIYYNTCGRYNAPAPSMATEGYSVAFWRGLSVHMLDIERPRMNIIPALRISLMATQKLP